MFLTSIVELSIFSSSFCFLVPFRKHIVDMFAYTTNIQVNFGYYCIMEFNFLKTDNAFQLFCNCDYEVFKIYVLCHMHYTNPNVFTTVTINLYLSGTQTYHLHQIKVTNIRACSVLDN